ncbi:TetR/AcrR family transcriptional regulator [Sphingomonas paeninsulae]|nr:TetR/AcrR family transcriptional regulator [Sphingomonas paeninsulae]
MADHSAVTEDGGSRRARNKARTTGAILDAAKRCIAEGGVQATTMDQIAAVADVSRATLFNYFASKADIIDVLVAENEAGFYIAIDAWRGAGGLTAGERLLGIFTATAHYLRRASPIERVLVGVSWLNWNELTGIARIERLIQAFGGLLEDGRHRGEIAVFVDLRAAAEIICNTYMGVIHAWRMDPDYPASIRLDAAARLLATMIMPTASLPEKPPKPPHPNL